MQFVSRYHDAICLAIAHSGWTCVIVSFWCFHGVRHGVTESASSPRQLGKSPKIRTPLNFLWRSPPPPLLPSMRFLPFVAITKFTLIDFRSERSLWYLDPYRNAIRICLRGGARQEAFVVQSQTHVKQSPSTVLVCHSRPSHEPRLQCTSLHSVSRRSLDFVLATTAQSQP
jgi:hypothetical protein